MNSLTLETKLVTNNGTVMPIRSLTEKTSLLTTDGEVRLFNLEIGEGSIYWRNIGGKSVGRLQGESFTGHRKGFKYEESLCPIDPYRFGQILAKTKRVYHPSVGCGAIQYFVDSNFVQLPRVLPEYLFNSVNVRLNVIAGFVDSLAYRVQDFNGRNVYRLERPLLTNNGDDSQLDHTFGLLVRSTGLEFDSDKYEISYCGGTTLDMIPTKVFSKPIVPGIIQTDIEFEYTLTSDYGRVMTFDVERDTELYLEDLTTVPVYGISSPLLRSCSLSEVMSISPLSVNSGGSPQEVIGEPTSGVLFGTGTLPVLQFDTPMPGLE